jgi:chromosome partitioning protein
MSSYSIKKLMNLFGMDIARNALIKAEKVGHIPTPARRLQGSIKARFWELDDLPEIGARYGFLKELGGPTAMAVFSTKGGVLKTTLSLNIARMAALHNIRTCVVGLDIQGDITKALGFYPDADEDSDLSSALDKARRMLSLADLFHGSATLRDIVVPSGDMSTLSLIPETSGLAALDVGLIPKARREYWLKDQVIEPLKERFDLIIMDCSPSWSQITSNALVACDILLSPLETKINHFRNYPDFQVFLDDFRQTMKLSYEHVAVPTRFNSTRKLSVEIRNWYLTNVPGCTTGVMREAITGEEAMSLCLSIPEFAPTSVAANEMRDLLREIWSRMPEPNRRLPAATTKQRSIAIEATLGAGQ